MPKFEIQTVCEVPIYGTTVVEAATMEEAISKARAAIAENEWENPVWEGWEQRGVDWENAERFRVDDVGHRKVLED